jgi:hypothetical protein
MINHANLSMEVMHECNAHNFLLDLIAFEVPYLLIDKVFLLACRNFRSNKEKLEIPNTPAISKCKAPKISQKSTPTNFDQIFRKKYLHLQYCMDSLRIQILW